MIWLPTRAGIEVTCVCIGLLITSLATTSRMTAPASVQSDVRSRRLSSSAADPLSSSERTSVKQPVTAAAAAVAGIKCVRPPLPGVPQSCGLTWRQRFSIQACRSSGHRAPWLAPLEPASMRILSNPPLPLALSPSQSPAQQELPGQPPCVRGNTSSRSNIADPPVRASRRHRVLRCLSVCLPRGLSIPCISRRAPYPRGARGLLLRSGPAPHL